MSVPSSRALPPIQMRSRRPPPGAKLTTEIKELYGWIRISSIVTRSRRPENPITTHD